MTFVLSKNDDDDFVVTTSLFLHSLELVILAVSYNPQQTIAILDRHDWTQQFFAQWFKNLPKYTRVHDKKMTLWAICALFDWLNGVGAASPLVGNVAQLVQGALEVFKTYPRALGERKVAEANRDLEEEDVSDDGMSDEDDLDLGDDGGDCASLSPLPFARPLRGHELIDRACPQSTRPTCATGRPTSWTSSLSPRCVPAVLSPVRSEAQRRTDASLDRSQANRLSRAGAFGDGDSAWSDEILWASPLDQFDSYQRFSGLLAGAHRSSLCRSCSSSAVRVR